LVPYDRSPNIIKIQAAKIDILDVDNCSDINIIPIFSVSPPPFLVQSYKKIACLHRGLINFNNMINVKKRKEKREKLNRLG